MGLVQKKQCCTSRPITVSNALPKPSTVNHLYMKKPKSSMNNDRAATQTTLYTVFPAKSKPSPPDSQIFLNE